MSLKKKTKKSGGVSDEIKEKDLSFLNRSDYDEEESEGPNSSLSRYTQNSKFAFLMDSDDDKKKKKKKKNNKYNLSDDSDYGVAKNGYIEEAKEEAFLKRKALEEFISRDKLEARALMEKVSKKAEKSHERQKREEERAKLEAAKRALEEMKKENAEKREKKRKQKLKELGTSYFQLFLNCFCALLSVAFFIGVVLLRAGEEQYNMGGNLDRSNEVDLYKSLNVHQTATQADIKKAFRKLSLRWHPDKNPDCKGCVERFREISAAYAILGDEEKRQVYDTTHGGMYDKIPSHTTHIDEHNFHNLIYESNDVWILQVYSDLDGLCQQFSSVWEDSATALGKYVNFGRLNSLHNKPALKFLPVKVKILPAVFVITRNSFSDIYGGILNPEVESFNDFILANTPDVTLHLNSQDDYASFVTKPAPQFQPKVLILSPVKKLSSPSLRIKSLALKWNDVFTIGIMRMGDAEGILKELDIKKETKGGTLFLLFAYDDENKKYKFVAKQNVAKPKNYDELSSALYSLQLLTAPYITRWNADLLCRSNIEYRVYCLFVFDEQKEKAYESLMQVYSSVKSSRERYLLDKKPAESEEEDEKFHVQLVRACVSDECTSTSFFSSYIRTYLPSPLLFFSSSTHTPSLRDIKRFSKFYSENLNKTSSFLLDLDGLRYSLPRTNIHNNNNAEEMSKNKKNANTFANNIYQKIEEEVISFYPLPPLCSPSDVFIRKCLQNETHSLFTHIFNFFQSLPFVNDVVNFVSSYF